MKEQNTGYKKKEIYYDFEVSGNIFNIQKFSIHDGVGIRTLIFLKGCPLNCFWCANPESQNTFSEIYFNSDKCINCKKCELVCPKRNKKIDRITPIFNKICILDCEKICVIECPKNALEIVGEKIKVKDIIKFLLQDKIFYLISDGGITISGGEPFYQNDFIYSLLKVLKYFNLNIAVETSGFFNYRKNIKSFKYIDSFLYDLKIIDKEKHIKYTGKSNEIIIKNLLNFIKIKKKITIRIPLIPNINNTINDIKSFINFLKPIYNDIFRIEVLPYHKLGIYKYRRLNRNYLLDDIETPNDKDISSLKNLFFENGMKIYFIS